MSNAPTPAPLPIWRRPEVLIQGVTKLIALAAMFGAFTAAESAQLQDVTSKLLTGVAVVCTELAAGYVLVRSILKRADGEDGGPKPPGGSAGPPTPPPPTLLAALLLVASFAPAQELRPLPKYTSSGRPIEASSFEPAQPSGEKLTRAKCDWQLGLFNRRDNPPPQQPQADPRIAQQLDAIDRKLDSLIAQGRQPIIVLPAEGAPKIAIPPAGEPKILIRPEGPPLVTPPAEGAPKAMPPADGAPKAAPDAGGAPKAAPRAKGWITYTVYRPYGK